MIPGTLRVEADRGRERLDLFLAARFAPEYSRARLVRMVKAGLVRLNGRPAKPSDIVRPGDRIEIATPPLVKVPVPAQEAPDVEVLFADSELIVVNKPAGMPVHPAPGHPHSTLVDAITARFPDLAEMMEPEGIMRPGIVHRLDKDTSGIMVVARTPLARAALARQFKERTVSKSYLAIVRGLISRERFTIARPLGRHPVERKRMSVRSRHPRDAVTHAMVLARFNDEADPRRNATLVLVRPETGRTHQIRVHLASVGHPCLGDAVYGGGSKQGAVYDGAGLRRQGLHAWRLAFDHPRTDERMELTAPLPDDFRGLLEARGLKCDEPTLRSWREATRLPIGA